VPLLVQAATLADTWQAVVPLVIVTTPVRLFTEQPPLAE
jgi:hypothetical protein